MKEIVTSLSLKSREVVWIVCESGNRWQNAVRHFGTEGLEDSVDFLNFSCDSIDMLKQVQNHAGKKHATVIVLWEITPKTIAAKCRVIAECRLRYPSVIQISGIARIPNRYQAMLSELGITVALKRPESLQRVARIINQVLQASKIHP